MNIPYILKESISGFKRAKLATITSISTITISLLLIGIFLIISKNTTRIVDLIRSGVEIEAFLEEPISNYRLNEIKNILLSVEGIDSVKYISKDQAAKIFKEDFGEDIQNVLGFNPLPPSFKIYLNNKYKNLELSTEIHNKIKNINGIDEVVFRKDIIEFLDKRTKTINTLGLILGIVVGLSAIFLVSNTIRLTIYSKRKIIQTMKLVGATKWFIRLPFLLEGMIQGIVGGIISSIILFTLINTISKYITLDLSQYIFVDIFIYIFITCAGIVLGLLGSIISVSRFIGESVTN